MVEPDNFLGFGTEICVQVNGLGMDFTMLNLPWPDDNQPRNEQFNRKLGRFEGNWEKEMIEFAILVIDKTKVL